MIEPLNPVVRSFDKIGLFDKPPTIEPGCQFVILTRQRTYQDFPIGVQPRASDLRAALKIYMVRVAADLLPLSGAVASRSDTFGFQLAGSVKYRISDPARMIAQSVTDVRAEVLSLVRSAITVVARNWNPQQVFEAQTAVMRVVEGNRKAAERLREIGYELLDLDIQLQRDPALLEIAKKTEITQAHSSLDAAEHARQKQQVIHMQELLSSGIYGRMALLATQGPEYFEKAIAALAQQELEELRGQIKIIEAMAPQLQDHQQKKLLEDIRGKLNNRFAAPRALQSDNVRGALADPQASAGELAPPEDY